MFTPKELQQNIIKTCLGICEHFSQAIDTTIQPKPILSKHGTMFRLRREGSKTIEDERLSHIKKKYEDNDVLITAKFNLTTKLADFIGLFKPDEIPKPCLPKYENGQQILFATNPFQTYLNRSFPFLTSKTPTFESGFEPLIDLHVFAPQFVADNLAKLRQTLPPEQLKKLKKILKTRQPELLDTLLSKFSRVPEFKTGIRVLVNELILLDVPLTDKHDEHSHLTLSTLVQCNVPEWLHSIQTRQEEKKSKKLLLTEDPQLYTLALSHLDILLRQFLKSRTADVVSRLRDQIEIVRILKNSGCHLEEESDITLQQLDRHGLLLCDLLLDQEERTKLIDLSTVEPDQKVQQFCCQTIRDSIHKTAKQMDDIARTIEAYMASPHYTDIGMKLLTEDSTSKESKFQEDLDKESEKMTAKLKQREKTDEPITPSVIPIRFKREETIPALRAMSRRIPLHTVKDHDLLFKQTAMTKGYLGSARFGENSIFATWGNDLYNKISALPTEEKTPPIRWLEKVLILLDKLRQIHTDIDKILIYAKEPTEESIFFHLSDYFVSFPIIGTALDDLLAELPENHSSLSMRERALIQLRKTLMEQSQTLQQAFLENIANFISAADKADLLKELESMVYGYPSSVSSL